MSGSSLYVPQLEHDSCGIGFVADLKERKSFELVQDAIKMLENMEHRGGCGSEPDTGDGAGIMFEVPHWFFSEEMEKQNVQLPDFGKYGVGMMFLPKDNALRQICKQKLEVLSKDLNFEVLGYREVPVDNSEIGATAKSTEPIVSQVFVRLLGDNLDEQFLERKLYVLRNYLTHTLEKELKDSKESFYIASFSQRTIV